MNLSEDGLPREFLFPPPMPQAIDRGGGVRIVEMVEDEDRATFPRKNSCSSEPLAPVVMERPLLCMESGTFGPSRDTAWVMPEETVANLRRGYEAFNRGDASVAMDLATPDVEWGTTGTFPGLVGVYRGLEAIPKWMDAIRSAWEEFEVTPDEVVRDEADVLVVAELERGRGRGSGVEVEIRVFSVYFFRQGKVRKRQSFTEREAALEAAGLSE